MTLRQLEMFLAVARAKSFTAGAEKLRLSQPTVSEQITELERELGVRLFDRAARTVTMTEAGRLLHGHAARVATTLTDARRTLDELKGLVRGALAIGASTTPGTYVVPAVVAAFRERHPGVQVSLQTANSRVIQERVRANAVDLGVIGGHVVHGQERCIAAGFLDELLLIVPPDHAWANRGELAVKDLFRVPLLMREAGSATRQLTERTLRAAGVKFSVAMELDHVEMIKQAVLAGLGIAFVSVHAIRAEVATGRLRTLRINGVPLLRHFHVIHHEARTLTPSGSAFVALLAGMRPATVPGDNPAVRRRPAERGPAAGT